MYDFFRGPIAAYERFYPTRTSAENNENVAYFLDISQIHVQPLPWLCIWPSIDRFLSSWSDFCTFRAGTYEFLTSFLTPGHLEIRFTMFLVA